MFRQWLPPLGCNLFFVLPLFLVTFFSNIFIAAEGTGRSDGVVGIFVMKERSTGFWDSNFLFLLT
jgi:hypothetical protein